jgi:uncharacterized hydrophobic protein (TIGR00271 family)
MSENLEKDTNSLSEAKESAEDVKKEFKGLLGSVRNFLSELLDIRKNTDREGTKEAIIADIPFKGHTAWILVCSIFIASIGLNANSTAVVIGAMLISPLMGPILGMGMSLAINDIDTLRRSIKNFTVMVILSVLTAYLFFEFFPLRDESSELLARTAPDIRDVLIAFFGGLALVIARAKKGTIASVIYGVAIATALMPPLCTVGFGLAIGNFEYAVGAMYLFTINTIFIGLATFLVLKLLRFPMVRYVNSTKRRFIARIASLVAILVMIPAGVTFYNVFQQSRFMNQANELVNETIGVYQFKDRGRFMDNLTEIKYNPNGMSTIELVCMGDELIPENVIDTWRAQKSKYSKLGDTDLKIVQGGRDDSEQKFNYVNELYETKKAELLDRDDRIRLLEDELANLSKLASKQIPFQDISAEAKVNYENLVALAFAYVVSTDFNKLDTIPVFEAKWKDMSDRTTVDEQSKKLSDWLKIRLKDDKVQLKTSTD